MISSSLDRQQTSLQACKQDSKLAGKQAIKQVFWQDWQGAFLLSLEEVGPMRVLRGMAALDLDRSGGHAGTRLRQPEGRSCVHGGSWERLAVGGVVAVAAPAADGAGSDGVEPAAGILWGCVGQWATQASDLNHRARFGSCCKYLCDIAFARLRDQMHAGR